jgi:hypothetical protein
MRRRGRLLAAASFLAAFSFPASIAGATARATLEVEPLEATVGDRLTVVLAVELPPDAVLEPPTIGPRLGSFTVFEGAWEGPIAVEGEEVVRYRWTGALGAFETGELEIPAIHLRLEGAGEAEPLSTEPVRVDIVSVLDDEGLSAEEADALADIKPPVSIAPDYGPLRAALIVFGVLLGVAVVIWWLQRRYASKLAAVAAPEDPFHRMPPHEWVYKELKGLLERRVAEQGHIDLFYGELAWILKRYLSGRYRIDLMEHTTEEVAPLLEQAGAPEAALEAIDRVLGACDRVKFAKERPGPPAWREAVEAVYDIVDETKPIAVEPAPAAKGAA